MAAIADPERTFLEAMRIGRLATVDGDTLAGVVADGVYYGVHDRWSLARTVRLLSIVVPASLFTLYFGTVTVVYDLVWVIHVWTGGIVSAGLVGLLMSYVVIPTSDSISPASGAA